MKRTVTTKTAEQTERLGAVLVQSLTPGTIVALIGSLGAGKTVFVRGLAQGLGISEQVTSPSFTLISEYSGETPLIHVDLYRTGSDEELELLGIDDILAKQAIVAIEWADKACSFLADASTVITVSFEIAGSERHITIDGVDVEFDEHAGN